MAGALWHVRGMVTGLLLAAGAGSRMGIPKALVPGWLAGSVDSLRDDGCVRVAEAASAAADGTSPPSDLNGDADYRRHLATVLTRRAVLAAAGG